MTNDERLAAIEARHRPCEPEVHDRDWLAKVAGKVRRELPDVPVTTMREPAHCDHCGDPWPCDAAIVLARLREVEQKYDALRDANAADEQTFYKVKAERDAARADADRLAEALLNLLDRMYVTYDWHVMEPTAAAALAAHEAAK